MAISSRPGGSKVTEGRTGESRTRLRIDVVSDVVCPWCFIGQKRLETALAAVPEVAVEVNWRPFQLDPTIPAGGADRKAYMKAKFGDESRIREMHERVEALGRAEGIAFDFEAIAVSPNTLDAHRVIRWASASSGEVQNRLVRRLFRLYFEEGADTGDHAVLARAAGESGMDAPVVETMLASDADRDTVAQEVATASRMGVTGVPCFLFEGKYAVMGAQDSAVLADAVRQIAAAKREGRLA